MAPCGRNFERALGSVLAFDITKIAGCVRRACVAGACRRDGGVASEMSDHGLQASRSDHLRFGDPSCLSTRCFGTQQDAIRAGGGQGSRKRARYWHQSAIEGQFTKCDRRFRNIGRHNSKRCQQGKRDGQVEM